ncbi:unnamed protein product [Paramecium primaurelia]|uniref:WD domain, G-beta repeat protein n=1 Tax=Paramecium primaurelia TaxID=5886 RepID=A0A8S1QDM7_PARPR|nr:unnamed protein product [Paramecium primaurelia]
MQIRCTQADHQNQQIIGFCIDSTCPNQRPYCHYCLPQHSQHLEKLTYFELFNEWIQKRIINAQNVQKNVQECKLSLDSLLNKLIPYLNFNIQQFSQIGISQIDNMIKGLCQLEGCEEILFKQLKQSIEQIKQSNQQYQSVDLKQSKIEQPQNQSTFKANSNQFTFQLMNQNSIRVDNCCFAFAFNKDQSIVLAGCKQHIKVFENQQGKLNQVQLLSKHTDDVHTLNFMKKTNNFVSGSSDNSIIIWQVIGNNQWNCQQILNGNSNSIDCLLINNTDDLIISGSYDKTIKFWIKYNQWICQQTISDLGFVYSLSLNEQQNKLISCSRDSQILIIEQSKLDKYWSVTQKIKVDVYGQRLCFINDNLFTFQPYCKDQMHIYELDINNKQYNKIKQIEVKFDSYICDCLFPQQYIKSKSILVNKTGKKVNLMRKKQNGDFIIQQCIQFGSYNIYGQLSDDGEYLITWDSGSKEIQIRRYKEQ